MLDRKKDEEEEDLGVYFCRSKFLCTCLVEGPYIFNIAIYANLAAEIAEYINAYKKLGNNQEDLNARGPGLSLLLLLKLFRT